MIVIIIIIDNSKFLKCRNSIRIVTIISSGPLCFSIALVNTITKINMGRKGFILAYNSQRRFHNARRSMNASNRDRKLADYFYSHRKQRKKNTRSRKKSTNPWNPPPSTLLPPERLRLQSFHSLPKECHQLGKICSNIWVHGTIFCIQTLLPLYTYFFILWEHLPILPISSSSGNKYKGKKIEK